MSERWNEMDDVDLLQLEAEMQGELEELRTAASIYADRAWTRSRAEIAVQPAARHGWMRWAAACGVAAVLAGGGIRLSQQRHAPAAQGTARAGAPAAVQVPEASPAGDEALLEQIQSDIASGVPAAMEPLQASTEVRGTRGTVQQ